MLVGFETRTNNSFEIDRCFSIEIKEDFLLFLSFSLFIFLFISNIPSILFLYLHILLIVIPSSKPKYK